MTCITYSNLINKTVGILGGGQLGRMLSIAAHNLGIAVVIFSDVRDLPRSCVMNETIIADYNNQDALLEFANKVDVVTLEFENIPNSTLEFLFQHVQICPNSKILGITQDRLKEKKFINALGIPTTAFEEFKDFDSIRLSYPFIIKNRSGGYDGKGQYLVCSSSDRLDVKMPAIVEKVVNFQKEISIITSRDINGNVEFFPIAENFHQGGILRTSSVPARINNDVQAKAQEIGAAIVEKMDYIGVIATELFLTKDNELLVNEMSPRVHNSGHWSVECCNVSQFEQHIRTICGLPVKPVQLYFPCEMYNLIGDDVRNIEEYIASPESRMTIYGKKEVRDGRKMGHITIPKCYEIK